MALNRWSLDRLLTWIGTTALLVLFLPTGLYLMDKASSSVEQHLSERGKSLVKTLAGQIIEPVLLADRLAMHDALHRVVIGEDDVQYLCIEDENGRILAHTFTGGYPAALGDLWRTDRSEVAYFRTEGGPVMDISTDLLDGQLGRLHVGMSRREATRAADRLMWLLGGVLLTALAVMLAGARIISARVSRPLQQLEAAISVFPRQSMKDIKITGTREVESLAKGFGEMIDRLETLEKDRAETQDRIIHAERLAALGELAAGLAHEVHNPLDGMLECLRFLQADPDKSDRAAKYYPMLQDGLERIATVMRGTLTFARSGQQVAPRPCSMADMMDALELLVRAQMQGRQIDLQWCSSDGCTCMCDHNGVTQAGLNLILNAAEAAEHVDDPQVRIEATCDERWVFLSVEDNGPGVPTELRERIFDAFFTTKPAGEGTGLGLAVSRQLIRAGGGELELDQQRSSLGGAKFVIKLPGVVCRNAQDDQISPDDTSC